MKEHKFLKSRQLPFLLLILVLLVAAGFWFVKPVAAQDGTDGDTSDAACLACHAEATTPFELPNGDLLSIQIHQDVYSESVHGLSDEVSCVTCHTNISGFPHPKNTAVTLREYQFQYLDTCAECHEEQASQTQDSIHGMLLAAGNDNAPACMDCHNPHAQPPIEDVSKVSFAQVCAQCHNGIYEEYTTSVHGEALLEGNQDVPGCVDCHGVHSIADPTTAEFRNSSIYMCADCHSDEAVMGKYGLSTNVLDTYVADFHGTTVTIFDETEPGQLTNKAVCYDCHGIHDILSVTDPNKGIAVKENMLLACQKCHPDATTNFPSSWLSHYEPDKEKFPIVYYVDLFYKILIPVVLGGMAVFVLADVYFRVRRRFQKTTVKSVPGTQDENKEVDHE